MALSKIRSGGINLADTFAFTGTVTGAGFTFATPVALNGQSSVTFSSLPSGVTVIKYGFWRESHSGGSGVTAIQLGDSGGIETSGYARNDSYHIIGSGTMAGSSSASDSYWSLNSWPAALYVMQHYGQIYRTHGNKWQLQANVIQSGSAPTYWVDYKGWKELSAELTQIKVSVTSGTWDESDSYVSIAYQ